MSTHANDPSTGLELRIPAHASDAARAAASALLTPEALGFVATLVRRFRPRLDDLLAARRATQARVDRRLRGEEPGLPFDFLEETRAVREGSWMVADAPADLCDRRVEITGPVDRKMIINALNSGARVFMADLEDANAPSFENAVLGQQNLFDAVRKTIELLEPKTGKRYRLAEQVATLMVRPRGLHLPERHLMVDGREAPGSLFDFGLFFFHNARELLARGSGPYFYLPKLESHHEAALWNDVFVAAQELVGVPRGSVRATVLIETLPAAFEMDEILHALREHSAGLNCGRWDYIFSFIKKHQKAPGLALPDRRLITMSQPFMKAYSELVIRTCHRRGAHAMGGMAAQIPIKDDPEKNAAALEKVRADKLREVSAGHDGTWVAHPGLVPVAREIFDAHMKGPSQLGVSRDDVVVTAQDLLRLPEGERTEEGLRENVRVGIQYVEAWLRGLGCVPLYHLMEDAATAEISRAQLWQWLHAGAMIETRGGPRKLDRAWLDALVDDELERLGPQARREGHRFGEARALFERLVTSPEFEEFLTLPAYDALVSYER
jgi:malate synthase